MYICSSQKTLKTPTNVFKRKCHVQPNQNQIGLHCAKAQKITKRKNT